MFASSFDDAAARAACARLQTPDGVCVAMATSFQQTSSGTHHKKEDYILYNIRYKKYTTEIKHNSLEIENCDFSTQYSTSNCFLSPSPSKTKPPTLFSLKTPTAYKPPRSRFMILRSLPVGRMQSLAQGCPRSSTDLARRRTGPTRLIPQNMRGKGAPGSVGSRLLPKKFSAACWSVNKHSSRKVFRSSKYSLPVTLAVFYQQIRNLSVAFATS